MVSDVTNGFPQHKTDNKVDASVSTRTSQNEAVKVVNNNKEDSNTKQNVTSASVKSNGPPPQKSHRESQKKVVKTCNHKHNNPNAKELRNLMEKKNAANPLKKSKSANSFPVKDVSGGI